MLLGEGGGRKVYASKRNVLLPAPEGEILNRLMEALDEELIGEDEFELVQDLTKPQATQRADATAMRQNPFLKDALAELDPLASAAVLSEASFASHGRGP